MRSQLQFQPMNRPSFQTVHAPQGYTASSLLLRPSITAFRISTRIWLLTHRRPNPYLFWTGPQCLLLALWGMSLRPLFSILRKAITERLWRCRLGCCAMLNRRLHGFNSSRGWVCCQAQIEIIRRASDRRSSWSLWKSHL